MTWRDLKEWLIRIVAMALFLAGTVITLIVIAGILKLR